MGEEGLEPEHEEIESGLRAESTSMPAEEEEEEGGKGLETENRAEREIGVSAVCPACEGRGGVRLISGEACVFAGNGEGVSIAAV